jgi:hypothetical protein
MFTNHSSCLTYPFKNGNIHFSLASSSWESATGGSSPTAAPRARRKQSKTRPEKPHSWHRGWRWHNCNAIMIILYTYIVDICGYKYTINMYNIYMCMYIVDYRYYVYIYATLDMAVMCIYIYIIIIISVRIQYKLYLCIYIYVVMEPR